MCAVLSSTGSEFHIVLDQRQQSSVDPCELSVFEEQQGLHAQPIVDAGIHYRLVILVMVILKTLYIDIHVILLSHKLLYRFTVIMLADEHLPQKYLSSSIIYI